MNEQLQQALSEILNKTMSGVDAGISFLSSEIPDVIHQLLVWKMAQASVFLSIHVIAATFGVFFILKSLKILSQYQKGSRLYYNNSGDLEKKGKELMDENAGALPFAIAGFVIGVISIIAMLVGGTERLSTVIHIWLAPKIYLIEYAASLAK